MINSFKTTSVIITFLLLAVMQPKTYGQEKIYFTSYAYVPKSLSDSLYLKLKNTSEVNERASILYTIANAYIVNGNSDSILHYAGRLNKLITSENKNLKDSEIHKARIQRLLGKGKFLNGLYDEALKAYIEGIAITESLGNTTEENKMKLGLGEVYLQQESYKKATSIFTEITSASEETAIVSRPNFYLGIIALKKEKLSAAKEYFIKAQSGINSEEDQKFNLWIELHLGSIAEREGKDNKALGIYETIIASSLQNNYFDIYTEAVLEYGKINIKLEQYQLAEFALATAYTNAVQWNRLELQKKIINSLRLIYQDKGDYENAYNLMTQYNAISEQIIQQQNSKVIKEIEVKYQTLQKENQIYELKEVQQSKQNEIERQKTIKKSILYGFIILLIPVIILLVVYYQKLQAQSELNKQQQELNTQKITSLLQTQELALVRTSLEAQQEERHRISKQLHDGIGGNLAGIKLQLANLNTNTKLQTEVMDQVNETYELVRDISHDLVPKKFNQYAFTILIENYIEHLKKNSIIEIAFSAHPKNTINNLSERFKVELYQIIQELFTNTLKHAEAKNIELHLTVHDAVLQLLFEDDGNGFNINTHRKGIGLENIKSRLDNINGTFLLDSIPNRGTAITIEISLKKE